MEEEIDLREYIEVLLKRWKWIVALSLLAAIAAFAVTSLQPKIYEAQADVIILQSKTEISLEPKYQTLIDDLGTQKTYRETLVGLVSSSEVAGIVLEQARDLLAPEAQTILRLIKKVDHTNTGDVISIKITDQNPELAAQLANIWARSYETYINSLFGNRDDALMVEVQNQVQNVEQSYKIAQANWEQFVNDNQIAVLEREIALKTERAEALQAAEITILNRELDILFNQAETLRNEDDQIQRQPVFLFNLEQNTIRQTLSQKYEELERIERWLADAYTLREQLEKPVESASAHAANALALIFLRSKVLASSASIPVELQLDLTAISQNAVSTQDADDLIKGIETRRSRIEADIQELSNQLLEYEADIAFDPRSEMLKDRIDALDNSILLLEGSDRWNPRSDELSQAVQKLDQEILALEAKLEAQQAQQRELRQTRDLAWENFTTAQRKLAEIELASQITDSQVRVAGSAIVPENPIGPRRLTNTAIAGALGLMLSVFGVFALEYWQQNNHH